ncbi:sigma-70 family RNA polymerase sigma factor [Priestia megaterium]|nr:sigma-70 family RNA polymerase sigma factor [Priestia megaterium]
MCDEEFQCYLNQVLAYLLKNGVNKQDAEDITQEVAVKYLENKHIVDPLKIKAWMFRVALNKRCDLGRKKIVKDRYIATYKEPEFQLSSPVEILLQNEETNECRMILNKLQPQYRHLLILKYGLGFKYEEIAQQLDMKMTTLKSSLYRARKIFIKQYM